MPKAAYQMVSARRAPGVTQKSNLQQTLLRLNRMHLFLSVLHGTTGILLLVLTDKSATAPIYSFFPDPQTRPGVDDRVGTEWLPVPRKHTAPAIGYFSGVFLLLASIHHFAVWYPLKNKYESKVLHNQNPFRWTEYFFSASFMRLQIALLCGLFDVHALALIFGATATTMLFGELQEKTNAEKQGSPQEKTFGPFWMGFVPHTVTWSVILCYFFFGVKHGDPPAFVWAIIFVLMLLDISFAINLYLQQKEIGRWRQYLFAELIYCWLSLFAKQSLAWLNFGGAQSLTD